MKGFIAGITLLTIAVSAQPQSYSTFTGYGQNYGYHGHKDAYEPAPYNEPEHYKQPKPYQPVVHAQPKPYQPVVHAQPKPYQPAYPQKHHHGYEQPKHNCTVQDSTEHADVCTPTFETACEKVDLNIKKIVDKEFCYTVTQTVCTETIEEIPNEICSYSYQKKVEDTTAKNVKVSFKKESNTQMVTVCQPGYGNGYQAYGHQYCKEVAQETSYNVPVVSPIDVTVQVSYPEPIKTCVNKPILLPRVSCNDVKKEKCITVPEVEDAVESVEKCITKLAEPSCQKIELTLPKQVCIELVYGYAEETHDSYAN